MRNVYKLKNVTTGEERTGSAEELEDIATYSQLGNYARLGSLLYNQWIIKIVGKQEKKANQKEQKKKKSNFKKIDDIAREAAEHGMTYGQYVAVMEMELVIE